MDQKHFAASVSPPVECASVGFLRMGKSSTLLKFGDRRFAVVEIRRKGLETHLRKLGVQFIQPLSRQPAQRTFHPQKRDDPQIGRGAFAGRGSRAGAADEKEG